VNIKFNVMKIYDEVDC